MDMKIDSTKIIKLRRQHAWSQQQLAEIACVSMRTIQRIESTGQASHESAKAIAAAFDTKVQELLKKDVPEKFSTVLKITTALLLASSFLSSVFFIAKVSAEPLMIKVQVTSSDKVTNLRLLQDSGQKSEMIFDDEFRVEITLNILADKKIHIQTQIFETNETGDPRLIASPSVITEHRTKATITFGASNLAHYEIDLIPHL